VNPEGEKGKAAVGRIWLYTVVYTEVDAACYKMHSQARRSNIHCCKNCQLNLTDGGLVYHTKRPHLSR